MKKAPTHAANAEGAVDAKPKTASPIPRFGPGGKVVMIDTNIRTDIVPPAKLWMARRTRTSGVPRTFSLANAENANKHAATMTKGRSVWMRSNMSQYWNAVSEPIV